MRRGGLGSRPPPALGLGELHPPVVRGDALRLQLLLHLGVLRRERVLLFAVEVRVAAEDLVDGLHVLGEVLHVRAELIHLPGVKIGGLLFQLHLPLLHGVDGRQGDLCLVVLECGGLKVELRAQQLVPLLLVHLLPLHGLHSAQLGCCIAAAQRHQLPDLFLSLGDAVLEAHHLPVNLAHCHVEVRGGLPRLFHSHATGEKPAHYCQGKAGYGRPDGARTGLTRDAPAP
mmetsp:Transcript_92353/g.257277  ORF Transcript_92353/g.257277 Transcript_92353/m.257277 type:complete len:229 (-) Transcript_92353:18-704(-)